MSHCYTEAKQQFASHTLGTNFLDEFLMKSSGLLKTFTPIFSEAAAKLVPVWLTSAV
jgi:hypothetical protein